MRLGASTVLLLLLGAALVAAHSDRCAASGAGASPVRHQPAHAAAPRSGGGTASLPRPRPRPTPVPAARPSNLQEAAGRRRGQASHHGWEQHGAGAVAGCGPLRRDDGPRLLRRVRRRGERGCGGGPAARPGAPCSDADGVRWCRVLVAAALWHGLCSMLRHAAPLHTCLAPLQHPDRAPNRDGQRRLFRGCKRPVYRWAQKPAGGSGRQGAPRQLGSGVPAGQRHTHRAVAGPLLSRLAPRCCGRTCTALLLQVHIGIWDRYISSGQRPASLPCNCKPTSLPCSCVQGHCRCRPASMPCMPHAARWLRLCQARLRPAVVRAAAAVGAGPYMEDRRAIRTWVHAGEGSGTSTTLRLAAAAGQRQVAGGRCAPGLCACPEPP